MVRRLNCTLRPSPEGVNQDAALEKTQTAEAATLDKQQHDKDITRRLART
jgi:hypothetical protein